MIAQETVTTSTPAFPGTMSTIRRATLADRSALLYMYLGFEPKGVCLGLPPRKEPQLSIWLDNLSVFPNFVVLVGERIVAHAALCDNGRSGEVAVFVHQDFRGRGFGKMLLTALVDEARRRGLKNIWGTTELDNVSMLRLARSLGFSPVADPREFFLLL
jgi:GNAT superfamily N-acetyltransferase